MGRPREVYEWSRSAQHFRELRPNGWSTRRQAPLPLKLMVTAAHREVRRNHPKQRLALQRRRTMVHPTKVAKAGSTMWRRIEITNFRSIESAKVTLAPFTITVGRNSSGKSNFADALVFARDFSTDASTAVQGRGGIANLRRWTQKGATDVRIDLTGADSKQALEAGPVRHSFTLRSGQEGAWRIYKEVIAAPELNFVRQDKKLDERFKQLIPVQLGANASAMPYVRRINQQLTMLEKVRRFRLNADGMRKPQIATERANLDESGVNIAVAVQGLKRDPERWKRIMSAMARIVPGLKDILVDNLGGYMVLGFLQSQSEGKDARFAAVSMSEGAIRALGILVAAEQMIRGELLIIEEPEVSLHSGAANLLFDVLKSASTRGAVLLTTHSAELLDAARDEEILVCEFRNGITEIGPLASEQRKLVKEGLFTVAELMRSEDLRIEGSVAPVLDPRSNP